MFKASIPRNPILFAWWSTKGSRRILALCWSAVFCGVVLTRTEFYAIGRLVDSATAFGNQKGSIDDVWYWTFLIVGLYVVGEICWRSSGFAAQKWMTATTARVYDSLFQYLTGHSTRYFQDRFAGAITNKISNAARGVLSLLQMTTWQFLTLLLGLSIDTYLVYNAHYSFAIVLVLWLVLFVSVDLAMVLRLREYAFDHAKASSSLKGKLVDSASNIETVHQQAEEPYEHQYVGKYVRQERDAHRKSWFMFEWILITNGVLLGLFTLVMFALSIWLFQEGKITVGTLAMMVTIVFNLERLLFFLGDHMSRAMQHYGEIDEGLDELLKPHEITNPPKAPTLALVGGEIEFRHVTFSYPEQLVFENLNIHIHAGQKVGLVGPSGAGKSSLVNILLRQYDVQEGEVLIDGQNIRDVNLSSLRKQIALVPQSTTLFHRSIAENIRYGRLSASREEIAEAAKKAQAHDFIDVLPKSYDTYVGERGVKLSGGQRQRISVARAMLKNAPILVLDEATSALDSESEHAIQLALEKLMEGRTVIAIAHRLSTLRQMDRILVMHQGKIVEDGSHHQLLALNGLYARLWTQQVGGFLSEEAA